jgi:hypothetical protein
MLFRRFLNACHGNVAPLVALAVIPIVGAISAAVDYSHASQTRSAMQAALDSTALMLAREAQTLSSDQIEAKATNYFNAIFTGNGAKNVTVTSSLQNPIPGSYVLSVNGSGEVPTNFSRILGRSEIGISASAEAVWGIKKLNLALALDNTGSMANSGKMDQLKIAAHNLLTTLQNSSHNPGDVKVSIVPFATDVNVATDNVNATWIDWSEWEAANGTCSRTRDKNKSDCLNDGKTWTPAAHSTWNGCVYDRDQSNDVAATATTPGVPATMFRAHQAPACPAAMMPLSDDWTALNAKIDAMTPTGNTNVTIGMAMAWQTLSSVAPFNAPSAVPDLERVIVVLTDGTNTQNRWTTSSNSIDARTDAVCANAKADNVTVYTVRVIDGNASLLQACATKTSMYYDVQDATQLNATFASIEQNLTNLRLAK